MSRIPFSETNEWRLANPAFDMRGMDAYGAGSVRQGRVVDLLLDVERQEVYGILLDTGKIYSARNARIANGGVYADAMRSERGEMEVTKEFGQPVRIVPAGAGGDGKGVDFDALFRRHFQERYGAEAEYGRYRPAYQLGRRAAMQGIFVGRPYRDARKGLSSQYRPGNNAPSFAEAEDAIRYAFEQVSDIIS